MNTQDLMLSRLELSTVSLKDAATSYASYLTALVFWSKNKLDVPKHKAAVKTVFSRSTPLFVDLKFTKPFMASQNEVTKTMLADKPIREAEEGHLTYIGQMLAYVDGKLDKATEIPKSTLQGIRSCAQYLRSESANSWKYIEKNVASLCPFLVEDAVGEIPDQQTEAKALSDLIKSWTGKPGIFLSEDQEAVYRKEHLEDYNNKYLPLRRHINATADKFLRDAVRRTPEKRMLYTDMLKMMNDNWIFHYWPPTNGWDGYVDENGALYTLEGEKIVGTPSFPIEPNPKYDPESTVKKDGSNAPFTCITSKGTKQYFYVEERKKQWKQEQFQKVDDFVEVLDDVRDNWLSDAKSAKGSKKYVLGILCELMYWTSARIGSELGMTDGKKTYGITTLRGSFVTREGNTLHIRYPGKSGVSQHHVLTPKTPEQKLVAKQVLEWAQEAGANGLVFDLSGQHEKGPSNGTVNNYLRSIGAPQGVTIHKIRHARATKVMKIQLRKCPFFRMSAGNLVPNASKQPTQAQAENWYKEAALEVGRDLGHSAGEKVTWGTAVAAYINPTTTTSFFDDLRLRKPTWAQKAAFEKD